MKIITERTLIREVAEKWREAYSDPHWIKDKEKQAIGVNLAALDPERATPADVEAVIGNPSWTNVGECDECGKAVKALVEVGQDPGYDSSTARICKRCATKALALF